MKQALEHIGFNKPMLCGVESNVKIIDAYVKVKGARLKSRLRETERSFSRHKAPNLRTLLLVISIHDYFRDYVGKIMKRIPLRLKVLTTDTPIDLGIILLVGLLSITWFSGNFLIKSGDSFFGLSPTYQLASRSYVWDPIVGNYVQ